MKNGSIDRRQLLTRVAAGGLASAGLMYHSGNAQAAPAVKHPHIREAVKALKEARVELKEADKVFGGHREKALKAVDDAIEQLEKALEFADKN